MSTQLPAEIAKAIEALRDAEHRHGSAYLSGGSNEHRVERLADQAADRLERLIIAHIAGAGTTTLGRAALAEEGR